MYRLTIVVASATFLFSLSGATGQIPCPYLRDCPSALIMPEPSPERLTANQEKLKRKLEEAQRSFRSHPGLDPRMREQMDLLRKKQAERLNAIVEEYHR
jgi:hypothetical protein